MQNDATGCGIIFHTRQAPPQKLDFSSIFAGAAAAAEQSQVGRPPQPSCPGMKYPVRDHPLTPILCILVEIWGDPWGKGDGAKRGWWGGREHAVA